MISRRNYLVTVLMMLVLLFMFQFSQIVKNNGNEYDKNEYQVDDLPTSESAWTFDRVETPEEIGEHPYVLFVGTEDSDYLDTVTQWCIYTKQKLYVSAQPVTLGEKLPQIMLVDSENVDVPAQMDALKAMAERGVTTVFLDLSDPEPIKNSRDYMEMLGIREVKETSTLILGVYLLDGFLLGGEAVYNMSEADPLHVQDFKLKIPYYLPGKGTKTYMVGLKDEKEIERKDFPRLIWRNNYNGTMVFGVCGDFCKSLAGLGILSGMVYESSDYDIYPVVNAHTVLVADYPSMAEENSKVLEDVYSRKVSEVMRDVMWPGILAMAVRDDIKITSYIQTKYDYNDPNQPEAKLLTFYMQQMKEARAELGRALNYTGNTTLAKKTVADEEFFYDNDCNYGFGAAYISKPTEEALRVLEAHTGLQGIHTLSSEDTPEYPLLSYFTKDVTLMEVTEDANVYSFTRDFRNRSIISALGYSNTLIDLHKVIWPENKEQQWQNYFSRIVSNVRSYYAKNFLFDQTTMSIGDERARAFLNADFQSQGNDNEIVLQVQGLRGEAYFILRTHGKQIAKMTGGEYKAMEEDAYLLKITEKEVRIELERSKAILEYEGPFK